MNPRFDTIVFREQRRTEKRAQFLASLQDPDLQDLVQELFGEQAPGTPGSHIIAVSGNGHQFPSKLTPALRAIADELPRPFKITDAISNLQQHKFDFSKYSSTSDASDAVRDAVYWLCKADKPVFRVAHQGKGGQPNEYEKV